jgi:tellurite resistance protein TerC
MSFPSVPEVLEAIPVVLSLTLINGLLSVDNSLAIAAMASRLPEHQRPRALNWGMAGAYGFRCLCLFFAAVILENDWVKLLGAAYLIYLMCKELTAEEDAEMEAAGCEGADPNSSGRAHPKRSFFSVVSGILLLDASLSVDNVVAAVAMTPKLWAVYVGVGISILALRFLAGYCIKLIERYPILESTAFLLVGFVGVILLAEMQFTLSLGSLGKFIAIIAIVVASLAYAQVPWVHAVFRPFVRVAHPLMRLVARSVGALFWPLGRAYELIGASFRSKSSP